MAFPLTDIRLAVRGRSSDHPTVHPRLIRDRAMIPKIDIAIQHFESMLGQERRAFDPEVLVHFLGDHKIARSIVACLRRSYTFQSPTLVDELEPADLDRLNARHLGSPVSLRLHLYDFVNDFGYGFLHNRERESELTVLAEDLGLTAHKLDRLLTLDAPEYAILRRSGPVPRAEDVAAHFNTLTLASLLRHSSEARVTIANDTPETLESIKRLSESNDVSARCCLKGGAMDVKLRGRQDALGNWGRHGHRLARMLVQLVQRAQRQTLEASAEIVMKARRGTLKLTGELLPMLTGPASGEPWWTENIEVTPHQLPELLGLADRGACRFSVRRWPELQGWQAGVLVPDASISVGAETRLVTVLRNSVHAQQLAALASAIGLGEKLVIIGRPENLALLPGLGARIITV